MTKAATAVEAVIRSYLDRGLISGVSYAIDHGGVEIETGVIGFADLETERPLADGSVFRLASMTKPITALAVTQLVSEGLIGLDDDVARYLAAFAEQEVTTLSIPDEEKVAALADPALADQLADRFDAAPTTAPQRAVTVRDLLSHQSGWGHAGGGSFRAVDRAIHESSTLIERVEAFSRIPADHQPGEDSTYSGLVGFDVLARIIEIVTGENFDEHLRRRILHPAGMLTTDFESCLPTTELVRLCELRGERVVAAAGPTDTFIQLGAAGGKGGSAGLVGTLGDYRRFAELLRSGGVLGGQRLVSSSAVSLLTLGGGTTSRLAPDTHWGLGVIVTDQPNDHRSIGAWGWSGHYGTHFYVDPERDETLVLMTNRSDIGGASSPLSADVEKAHLPRGA